MAPGTQSYYRQPGDIKAQAHNPGDTEKVEFQYLPANQPFPSNRFWAVRITHACQVAGRVPVCTGQRLLQSQERSGEGKAGAAWCVYAAFIS